MSKESEKVQRKLLTPGAFTILQVVGGGLVALMTYTWTASAKFSDMNHDINSLKAISSANAQANTTLLNKVTNLSNGLCLMAIEMDLKKDVQTEICAGTKYRP